MKKKILITGKNSYIGRSFINYCRKNNATLKIDEIETNKNQWEDADFSNYDTIFHVAGIAHNSTDSKMKDLYYEVNTDLAIDIAKKAKENGVKHFIFMSSMIVFGKKINPETGITKETIPNPENFYGDSKLQAEIGIKSLEDDNFKLSILRPPMIYGKGSKGNYPLLSKFAKITPIFPKYDNKRSMLHIDNFCEFVRLIVENEVSGTFHPQNKEYVQTTEMVRLIAKINNHKVLFTTLFNVLIKVFINTNLLNKIFGNYYYSKEFSDLSDFSEGIYHINNLEESIKATERSEL